MSGTGLAIMAGTGRVRKKGCFGKFVGEVGYGFLMGSPLGMWGKRVVSD